MQARSWLGTSCQPFVWGGGDLDFKKVPETVKPTGGGRPNERERWSVTRFFWKYQII